MIRINLLPAPRSVRERQGTAFVWGANLLAMLILVWVCGWWQTALKAQYLELRQERDKTHIDLQIVERRIAELETIQQRYDQLRRDQDELMAMHRAVGNPAMLLEVISREIDDLDLWLHRLALDANQVEIEGQALDDESVRRFLDRLERSPVVANLQAFTLTPIQDSGTQLYRFNLHIILAEVNHDLSAA